MACNYNDTNKNIIRPTIHRKRGRPKTNKPQHDKGTPELVYKRLSGDTMESLDILLEKGFISRQQHWCGMHLRWLYTLRYGAPSIRAVDPSYFGGLEHKPEDNEWRTAREEEYNTAINKLKQQRVAKNLINICVFDERPIFLRCNKKWTFAQAEELEHAINSLCDGLDILTELWKRQQH